MLERLAHLVMRHRRLVIVAWIVLTLLGVYSAMAVSNRWLEQFSIPGYSAYEANQRTLKTFGTGGQPPHVVVFHADRDRRADNDLAAAIDKVSAEFPDFRVGSYFTTNNNVAYVSKDGRTTFATLYPPGQQSFSADAGTGEIRHAFEAAVPQDVTVDVTGRDALYDSEGGTRTGRACSPRP